MEGIVIEVKQLSKSYGETIGAKDISFDVEAGEIFSILGPNGAGKTTVLECLEGLRHPESGKIQIAGVDPVQDPRKLRNLIGVQLQSGGLPENITPVEAMNFFCAYHGVPPRIDLLNQLGLNDKKQSQYFELSTGNQRRLALALAIAHEPKILFLDEPTAGLDVASRAILHDMMRELKESGKTIILATHDMFEAEQMSDRVAILLLGSLVTIGTPMEITSTGAGFTKISVQTKDNSCRNLGSILPGVQKTSVRENYLIFYSDDISATLTAMIAHLDHEADVLIDLRVERPSLEERFLEITNAGGAR
jgi:ABC-2 type transport system ATP-binding protein